MSFTQCYNYITSKNLNLKTSFGDSVPVDRNFKRNFKRDFNQDEGGEEPVAKVAKIDTSVDKVDTSVDKVDTTFPRVCEKSMKRKLTEFKLPVAKVAKVNPTSIKCLKRKFTESVESYKMVEEPVAKILKVDTFSTSLPRSGETSMNCLKRKLSEYGHSNHFRTDKEWYAITGLCGFKNETTLQMVMSRLVEDTFLERVNDKLRLKKL